MGVRGAIGRTRAALNDDPADVDPKVSLGIALGIVLAAVIGVAAAPLLGSTTIAVGILTALFLSVIATNVPTALALRLILINGLLMIIMVGLAVVTRDTPVLAALCVMVFLMAASIWTALPIVGGMLGTFPAVVFLLVIADSTTLTSGAPALQVMLATLPGIVGALVVAVVFGGLDPRGAARKAVAGMWSPTATRQQQGSVLQMLRLQSAPTTLVGLLHCAIIAGLARDKLVPAADPATENAVHDAGAPDEEPAADSRTDDDPHAEPADDDAAGLSVAADQAIAAALMPRGRLVPRDVTGPVDKADGPARTAEEAASDRIDAAAWHLWRWAHQHSAALLDGSSPARVARIRPGAILADMGRSLVRPASSTFRYAVQRTLAIGIAVAVVSALRGNTNSFWIALTLLLVMQPDSAATVKKAVRAAAGTWVGVVLALLLATFLPAALLVPWVAAVLLIGGFAWLRRNYASMTVGTAAAVVLLTGVPVNDVGKWALLRGVDVVVACLIAVVVTRVVLPVRADPAGHVAAATQALQESAAGIRAWTQDAGRSSLQRTRAALDRTADVVTTLENLRSDVADPGLPDRDRYDRSLAELEHTSDDLLALGGVILSSDQADNALIVQALDRIDDRLATLAAAEPTPA